METVGEVHIGVQQSPTNVDQLETRAGSVTTSTHKSDAVSYAVLANNKSTIDINTEVPADTNCVLAGPITVGASATLTISGTLTIV